MPTIWPIACLQVSNSRHAGEKPRSPQRPRKEIPERSTLTGAAGVTLPVLRTTRVPLPQGRLGKFVLHVSNYVVQTC